MATVINTTPATRDTSESAAAGWAVAIIVLIAAGLIALFVWPGYVRQSAPAPAAPGATINVTLPTTGGETGGNASGPASGGQMGPESGTTPSGM